MKKIKEKIRKLLFSTSYKTILFTVCVVAISFFVAWFAQDIVFYQMDTTAGAYDIQFVETDKEFPEMTLMDLDYNRDTIQIVTNGDVAHNEISVYASSRYGAAKLTEENMQQLDETFLGSFAAAYPKQTYDIDGDGEDENVFYFVKTDLRFIQPNSGATPLIRDKAVTMEIGMDSFNSLYVYFQTKPLGEREVILHMGDGSKKICTTDAAGYITGLSANQIREGITIEYAPNGLNTYLARYVPETTNVFSETLLPFVVLVIVTSASITFCVLLRSAFNKKNGKKDYTFRSKVRRTYKPTFVIVRWIVMFFSFLLLTWGGSVLGYWFEELYIPVLSCSKYNQEQIVASACYYMSHLHILFTLPIEKILVFFACFFIPLFAFGKLFCGFVCPMGFVQDTIYAVRQKSGIQGVSLTEKLYERLAIIKWTVVMLFLGMGFAGLDFCNICPAITLSPAFSGFKTTVYVSGFIMLFVLAGSFFKSRFFCNICPLGLLMGLLHKASLVRLKKDGTACTECGACYNACPMGIKAIYTEREQINVTDTNCIMCGECIRNCPEDKALQLTWAGISLYISSRDEFMKRYEKKEDKVCRKKK